MALKGFSSLFLPNALVAFSRLCPFTDGINLSGLFNSKMSSTNPLFLQTHARTQQGFTVLADVDLEGKTNQPLAPNGSISTRTHAHTKASIPLPSTSPKALFVCVGLVDRNDSEPDCFSNLYKI
jgi:hypothetical protein